MVLGVSSACAMLAYSILIIPDLNVVLQSLAVYGLVGLGVIVYPISQFHLERYDDDGEMITLPTAILLGVLYLGVVLFVYLVVAPEMRSFASRVEVPAGLTIMFTYSDIFMRMMVIGGVFYMLFFIYRGYKEGDVE